MITFSRRLARRVRAVFRRALRPSPRENSPSVTIIATPRTLKFTTRNDHLTVCYEETGRFRPAELAVPLSFFDDCAGSRTDLIQLAPTESGALVARWNDDGIEQILAVEQRPLPTAADFPSLPKQLTKNPPRLVRALRDAAETTDATSSRYALGCIQLRGKRGEIAATDGRQLLLQRGFEFPFDDDLLIGRHQIFQSSELLAADHVAVGLHDGWFTLRAGNWTVQIHVETEGRFPRIEDVIPPIQRALASCRISPADGLRLVRSLPLLPSNIEQDSPVTIDLNGHFVVRARSPHLAQPVEVTLTGYEPQGEPLRVAVNRRYLERVGKLGLGELHLFGRDAALHARDEQRSYIWMPLAASAIVPPVPADSPLTCAAA